MSDLISRRAVINALKEYFSDEFTAETEYGAYWHHQHVIDVIERMPSAESERKVGRCNQCKYYEGVHDVPGCAPCAFWGIGAVMWDDFCKRGEQYDSD